MLKHTLVLALLFLPIQNSIAQSKAITAKEKFSRVLQKFSIDCEMQKIVLEIDPSPKSAAAVQPLIDMFCTCLPREVGLLQAKVSTSAMSLDTTQNDLKSAVYRCSAELIKKSTFGLCMADSAKGIKAERQESYCQCIQAGVNQLSDQEITQATRNAHANFRAKVDARTTGKPAPKPLSDAMRKLGKQCEAKHAG